MDPQAQSGLFQMILQLLAGSGFKDVTEGISKLAQSGQDPQQIFSLPGFPMLMAGAGIRNAANSMELINPIMKMMQPPQPPQNQSSPEQTAAAMQMLSARLGAGGGGMQGIQPPNLPMAR